MYNIKYFKKEEKTKTSISRQIFGQSDIKSTVLFGQCESSLGKVFKSVLLSENIQKCCASVFILRFHDLQFLHFTIEFSYNNACKLIKDRL